MQLKQLEDLIKKLPDLRVASPAAPKQTSPREKTYITPEHEGEIALINHAAAVRLYNLLADRLQQYAALCHDGNAESRGDARMTIEVTLPHDGWLGKLLSPTNGKVITMDDVASLFPPQ